MLPNANHMPSESVQLAVHVPIALTIGGELGVPEFLIATWSLVALRTTVPKAAVHKNNNPLAPKGEVRFTQKSLVAPPVGDTELTEDRNQAQLRRLVAARADQ